MAVLKLGAARCREEERGGCRSRLLQLWRSTGMAEAAGWSLAEMPAEVRLCVHMGVDAEGHSIWLLFWDSGSTSCYVGADSKITNAWEGRKMIFKNYLMKIYFQEELRFWNVCWTFTGFLGRVTLPTSLMISSLQTTASGFKESSKFWSCYWWGKGF